MKNTIISITLIAGMLMLFSAASLAQQIERQIVPLSEDDYTCMQQLNCVMESESLKEKGWVVTLDPSISNLPQERTARLEGKGISLKAEYDKTGNLLKAKYERTNAPLPRVLLSHLASNNKEGWIMTANKIIVRDFNAASTKYSITLENDFDTKTTTYSYEDVLQIKNSQSSELANNQQER